MADLGIDDILTQLDEQYEGRTFSPSVTSDSSGESDDGGQPTNICRSDPKNLSLPMRTPDVSHVSKGARRVSTDPGQPNKVGSRRSARCWSESSGDESPTLQRLSKASSHKKAKRQYGDRAACSNIGGQLAESTPKTTPHTTKKKSVPRQITTDKSCRESVLRSGDVSSATGSMICAQLGEITNLLQTLDKRVANTEKELKNIKTKLRSTSSSESSTKESVPLIVRSETRKTYKTLLEEKEDFGGFVVGPEVTFKAAANQRVVLTLIKEVKSANPTFDACHVRAAAYTYYKTLTQGESLQRRGKADERNQTRRRRERLNRKLQDRKAAFKKCCYKEEDIKKWSKVLISDCMSSEESDDEDTIIVRPLLWRTDLVNAFFAKLDARNMEQKSPQARRQQKARFHGEPSTRLVCESLPSWALKPTVM